MGKKKGKIVRHRGRRAGKKENNSKKRGKRVYNGERKIARRGGGEGTVKVYNPKGNNNN